MVCYFTVKGYTRKGGVLYGLKRFTDAQKTYQEALQLDSNNKVTDAFAWANTMASQRSAIINAHMIGCG